nr:MAG TPA: hypothetical protein [Caudoviricetes sp.]
MSPICPSRKAKGGEQLQVLFSTPGIFYWRKCL